MKTFYELTGTQQSEAVSNATNELLKTILEGGIRFNDQRLNHDDLQSRIDSAIQKAEEMQTPWFAGEYIMDTCRDEIEGMSRCNAKDTMYYGIGEILRREPVVE